MASNGSWLLAIALIFSITSADAVERKDASYLCVAESAGGLAFNPTQKKWVGMIIKTSEKFILRLKFVDVEFGTGKFDKDEQYSNFEVDLTKSGTDKASKCVRLGGGDKKTISIPPYDAFTCYANLEEYVFNLNTNRYLNIYSGGYTDGVDSNENTPSVTGGVCTKIN